LRAASREETLSFEPQFDRDGLITAVVTDAGDGTLLMVAYMNREALRQTRESGLVHFFSRSRQSLWKKGETSGEFLELREILTDCDQDVLQVKAVLKGRGAACHTGRRSCFYRRLASDGLEFTGEV
jgi:phosphoribosyl-AMP cyclohydrolase